MSVSGIGGVGGFGLMVDELLREMACRGVSDLHLEPQAAGGQGPGGAARPQLRVWVRLHGALARLPDWEKRLDGHAAAVLARLKVLASLDVAQRRLPQDGSFRIQAQGGDGGESCWDLRLATAPTQHGERATVRMLGQSVRPGLHELGCSARQRGAIDVCLQRPHGLILAVGPTGSGKTTSLYAMLRQLDMERRCVLTIEDPVEYDLPQAGQVQVNAEIGLSFAVVLRSLLRHDPEVMMVGEIRDAETAEIAFRAALTGHLVLSTLHTATARGAAERLREMGLPDWLVRSALRLVVSQRLLPRACRRCWDPAGADGQSMPAGCAACLHTGCRGRVGVFEVHEGRGGDWELVGESMREGAQALVAAGEVAAPEAERVLGGA